MAGTLAAVAAVAILTFPPLVLTADTSLDGSWVLALNVAAARGWVHGRDIVWTFGPLAPAVYPMDVGSNLAWAVPLRLGIVAAWWWAVGRLLHRTRGVIGPLVLAAAMVWAAEVEQFTAPLLLACLSWLAVAHHERRARPAAIAAALAALAVLMKFNVGLSCAVAVAVWAGHHALAPARARRDDASQRGAAPSPGRAARRRAIGEAGAVGAAGLGTLAVAWRLSNGPLARLPHWTGDSLRLLRGFGTQLALAGPASDLVWAIAPLVVPLAAGLALRAAAPGDGHRWPARRDVVWAAIVALPLFAVFKASFVRHDLHALHWFVTLPGCVALALPGDRRPRGRAFVALWTTAALAAGVGWMSVRWPGGAPWPTGPARVVDALRWPATRARAAAGTAAARASLAAVPARTGTAAVDVPGIVGDATIDSYPWDLAAVLLPGLNWTPRYVLQSYQAYDPDLDRASAARIEGPAAPRYILYRHIAVDGTQPVAVDPATWRAIWRWYEIEAEVGDDALLLAHRKRPRFGPPRDIAAGVGRLGVPLDVPAADGKPVLLHVDIAPSHAGRLLAAAYRLAPPEMDVERLDGTHDRRRVVWANLPNGILASHLPQWLPEVRPLLRTDWTPPPPTVRRVTFVADGRWWRTEFAVRWAVVER